MEKKLYISKKADLLVMIFVTVAFLSVCLGVLSMPEISIDGAKNGLNYSLGVLIPSLFPFMFLSDFAVEYGISDRFGKILSPMTEKLFYLPGEAGVTVILSLIGGFPVGASGINALLKQGKITQSQAQRMIYFCVNSGPAFMISVVGAELYDNVLLGVILLVAQIFSSVLIGILLGIVSKRKEPLQKTVSNTNNKKSEFAPSFIISCKNACRATVNLCALVVLFSTFSALLINSLDFEKNSLFVLIIKSLLEVTDGCNSLSKSNVPIYLVSLAIGWSGLCVHFQIFSAAEGVNIPKIRFFISRLMNGVFSSAITFLLTLFIVQEQVVFSNISETTSSFSSSTFYGSLSLFCASVFFLIFMNTYIKAIAEKNK